MKVTEIVWILSIGSMGMPSTTFATGAEGQ